MPTRIPMRQYVKECLAANPKALEEDQVVKTLWEIQLAAEEVNPGGPDPIHVVIGDDGETRFVLDPGLRKRIRRQTRGNN